MRKILFLFMSIILIMSCNKCKERCDDPTNPECPNYVAPDNNDPCAGVETTNSDFIMYQSLLPGTTQDTLIQFYHDCMWGKAITLHAIQDSAEYHWIIGTNHYYSRDVTFQIGFEFVNQEIPLTLIINRSPNLACYPEDIGADTTIKSVMPKNSCEASIWGKYYGAWMSNPSDSFVLEIISETTEYPHCSNSFLIGFNPSDPDTCFASENIVLDNFIKLDGTATYCYGPMGWALLDSTMTQINIEYSINENSSSFLPRIYNTFRGHRLS
jgi:hypothetical protein